MITTTSYSTEVKSNFPRGFKAPVPPPKGPNFVEYEMPTREQMKKLVSYDIGN